MKYFKYPIKEEPNNPKNTRTLDSEERRQKETYKAKRELTIKTNYVMTEIGILFTKFKFKPEVLVDQIADTILNHLGFDKVPYLHVCNETNQNHLYDTINAAYMKYLANSKCLPWRTMSEVEAVRTLLPVLRRVINKQSSRLKAYKRIFYRNTEPDDIEDIIRKHGFNTTDPGLYHTVSETSDVRLDNVNDNKRSLSSIGDEDSYYNYDTKLVPKLETLPIDRLDNVTANNTFSKEKVEKPYEDYTRRYITKNIKKDFPLKRSLIGLLQMKDNVSDFKLRQCEKIASYQFLRNINTLVLKFSRHADCINEIALKTNKLDKSYVSALYNYSDSNSSESEESNERVEKQYDVSLLMKSDNDQQRVNKKVIENKKTFAILSDDGLKERNFRNYKIPFYMFNARNKRQLHGQIQEEKPSRSSKIKRISDSGISKLSAVNIEKRIKKLGLSNRTKWLIQPIIKQIFTAIYGKLPPVIQTAVDLLKPMGEKYLNKGELNAKGISRIIGNMFKEGKGIDLFKLMSDKLKTKKRYYTSERKNNHYYDNFEPSSLGYTNEAKFSSAKDASLLESLGKLDFLPKIQLPSKVPVDDGPMIELYYILKHPRVIKYQPQFLVRHKLPYDIFSKNIRNIYSSDTMSKDDQIQLVKVIKKDGAFSDTLYETEFPTTGHIFENDASALLNLYHKLNDLNSGTVTPVHENVDLDGNNNDNKINKETNIANEKIKEVYFYIKNAENEKEIHKTENYNESQINNDESGNKQKNNAETVNGIDTTENGKESQINTYVNEKETKNNADNENDIDKIENDKESQISNQVNENKPKYNAENENESQINKFMNENNQKYDDEYDDEYEDGMDITEIFNESQINNFLNENEQKYNLENENDIDITENDKESQISNYVNENRPNYNAENENVIGLPVNDNESQQNIFMNENNQKYSTENEDGMDITEIFSESQINNFLNENEQKYNPENENDFDITYNNNESQMNKFVNENNDITDNDKESQINTYVNENKPNYNAENENVIDLAENDKESQLSNFMNENNQKHNTENEDGMDITEIFNESQINNFLNENEQKHNPENENGIDITDNDKESQINTYVNENKPNYNAENENVIDLAENDNESQLNNFMNENKQKYNTENENGMDITEIFNESQINNFLNENEQKYNPKNENDFDITYNNNESQMNKFVNENNQKYNEIYITENYSGTQMNNAQNENEIGNTDNDKELHTQIKNDVFDMHDFKDFGKFNLSDYEQEAESLIDRPLQEKITIPVSVEISKETPKHVVEEHIIVGNHNFDQNGYTTKGHDIYNPFVLKINGRWIDLNSKRLRKPKTRFHQALGRTRMDLLRTNNNGTRQMKGS